MAVPYKTPTKHKWEDFDSKIQDYFEYKSMKSGRRKLIYRKRNFDELKHYNITLPNGEPAKTKEYHGIPPSSVLSDAFRYSLNHENFIKTKNNLFEFGEKYPEYLKPSHIYSFLWAAGSYSSKYRFFTALSAIYKRKFLKDLINADTIRLAYFYYYLYITGTKKGVNFNGNLRDFLSKAVKTTNEIAKEDPVANLVASASFHRLMKNDNFTKHVPVLQKLMNKHFKIANAKPIEEFTTLESYMPEIAEGNKFALTRSFLINNELLYESIKRSLNELSLVKGDNEPVTLEGFDTFQQTLEKFISNYEKAAKTVKADRSDFVYKFLGRRSDEWLKFVDNNAKINEKKKTKAVIRTSRIQQNRQLRQKRIAARQNSKEEESK